MNGPGHDKSPSPKLSVAQAKANLLAQGEAASQELDAFIARTKADVVEVVDDVTRNVKRAVPWAAAAAVGAGFFMGRGCRGRRGAAGGADGVGVVGETSRTGRTFDKLKWVATTVGPVLVDFLLRPKRDRSGPGGRGSL